jgi:hypothetical protein
MGWIVAWIIQVILVPTSMAAVLLYVGTQPLRLRHPESRRASRAGFLSGLGITALVLIASKNELDIDQLPGWRDMQVDPTGLRVGVLIAGAAFVMVALGNRTRPGTRPPSDNNRTAGSAGTEAAGESNPAPEPSPNPDASPTAGNSPRAQREAELRLALAKVRTADTTLRKKIGNVREELRTPGATRRQKLRAVLAELFIPVVYTCRHGLLGLIALVGTSGSLLAARAYVTQPDASDTIICAALTASALFGGLVAVLPATLNSRANPPAIFQ